MKKITLIGANGFLGKNVIKLYKSDDKLKNKFNLVAADIDNTNISSDIPFHYIDITKQEDLTENLLLIEPDIIILTAAMTDVDQCEIKKELATKINFEGPKNVINACKKLGSKLLFMSTDFIFNGEKSNLYTEEDIPKPKSHYGKTKFFAELAILYSGIKYLICRTSVLYGWNPNKLNFITWILKNLKKKNKLSIVTNQINSPTYVNNLANVVFKLIENDANGIFHTAGASSLSRYEMALKCAEVFNYNKELITPIDSLNQDAQRPENAGLNVSKLKDFLKDELEIFTLEEGLNHMKNHRIDR
jgi:dTDP-4-dehydrorhamnose reductase